MNKYRRVNQKAMKIISRVEPKKESVAALEKWHAEVMGTLVFTCRFNVVATWPNVASYQPPASRRLTC